MKKGSLSVDFIFSFVVTCFLAIYFLMTALTLSLVEVAQYISYATAREYFISHKDLNQHRVSAERTYNTLKEVFFHRVMKNWFEIKELHLGVSDSILSSPSLFLGAQFSFVSKILNFNVPFLKNAEEDFKAEISSYLGREPSQEECRFFMDQRVNWLKDKGYRNHLNEVHYTMEPGNGC